MRPPYWSTGKKLVVKSELLRPLNIPFVVIVLPVFGDFHVVVKGTSMIDSVTVAVTLK